MSEEAESITTLTGAHAASYAMKQINPDVVAAFPITPQTDVMMNFSEFVADGEVDTELILVESEHSAMSAVVGSSAAGARSMTATSSAGLALMFEVLGVASGSRLPIVMNVVNRALSAPINIHCDHSDSMDCRDIGWIQTYNEDAQEVYDTTIIGVKLAERVKLPLMTMQDGFINSHALQNIQLLKNEEVQEFLGEYEPEHSLLNTEDPVTMGPLQLQDYYFETKRQEAEAMKKALSEYEKVCEEYKELTGREYHTIEEYELEDADYVIVALSSVCGAVKEVVDELREDGEKAGLLRIKLFRPFPYNTVKEALKDKEKIIVLDRSESFGGEPPVMSEVLNSLYNTGVEVNSVIFGLGGRSMFEDDIKELYKKMIKSESIPGYAGCRE